MSGPDYFFQVVNTMNVIPCLHPCLYQKEGRCTLTQATSQGRVDLVGDCAYFLPDRHLTEQQNRKSNPS